jgi:hypothetical protein
MDQLAGTITLVPKRRGRRPVQVREPGKAGSAQYAVDGGARVPEHRAEPMGPDLQSTSTGDDPADLGRR